MKSHFWKPPTSMSDKPEIFIIFDIDGTLIEASRLHSRAFEYTFKKVFGIKEIFDWPNYQGRTDPWILREIARMNGISSDEIKTNFDLALSTLSNYYEEHVNEEKGIIHPGVTKLLSKIDEKNILRGLVTGNVERIGYLKLKHFGLEQGFALGKFGTDHIERAELLRLVIKAAQEKYNYQGNHAKAFYVADTPFDVEAAHAAGIQAIAVKTSSNKNLDFTTSQPELILDNLSQIDEFFDFIYDSKHKK